MTHAESEYNSLLYLEEQLWYNILSMPNRIKLKTMYYCIWNKTIFIWSI